LSVEAPGTARRPAVQRATGPGGRRQARQRTSQDARRLRAARRSAGYVVLVALSGVAVYPFLWMLLTSLRPRDTVFTGGFVPDRITFGAYTRAWSLLDFPSHFMTSVVITTLTVAAVLALATLAGYSFAKLNFPGKQVIYVILLSTLMLPATALILPLFLQMKNLGLLNTRQGLILVYIGVSLPFAMFLMRAFFETLPDELIHAARVDGAGEFRIFWRIMLPLAAPGVATVVVFQFLSTWNEFLLANTLLQSTALLPLQPHLFTVTRSQHATDWTLLCAALTMSVLPIVLVYVRMQKRFVAGLTLGATKY
jgi:ABC-type glycerol-3-phosphate transport system permease component